MYIYPRCVSTTFPNCSTIKDHKIQIGGFLFGPSNIFFEKFGAKNRVCLLDSNFRGLSKVASMSKPSFLRVLFHALKLSLWSFPRALYLPHLVFPMLASFAHPFVWLLLPVMCLVPLDCSSPQRLHSWLLLWVRLLPSTSLPLFW